MFKIITLVLSIVLFQAQLIGQATLLEVEPNHSTIGFRISISGFTVVTGKFTDYSIDINYSEGGLLKSSFNCTIQAASINTGIDDRDDHLRSADFFDVQKYPTITFQSDSIRQVNYAEFEAFGIFSMHGVSKSIVLPFTLVKKEKNTLGFMIRTSINRIDYGIGQDFQHTSMPDFLGKEIEVEIDFWTRKKK